MEKSNHTDPGSKQILNSSVSFTSPSVIVLILVNLIPLGGAFYFDWQVGDLMVLYWTESAVIGFYNLIKMGFVGGWLILLLGPFFILHYGGFMAGHLVFINAMFFEGLTKDVGWSFYELIDVEFLIPVVLAFFVSHGVSFYFNFIRKREWQSKDLNDQMKDPYKRILVMHLTILLGGSFVIGAENHLPALLMMIVLKMATDIYAHFKEHKQDNTEALQTT